MAQQESTRNSTNESAVTEVSRPTHAERFFFDNNGYLVVEDFLKEDHINALTEALLRVVARRREQQEKGISHTGHTQINGARSARILYILDDDPLFLQMLDWPPIMPYVTGLLNERPHHHSSDAFVEYGSDQTGRGMGWHIDGHDNGYRDLGHAYPTPTTQDWLLSERYDDPRTGQYCHCSRESQGVIQSRRGGPEAPGSVPRSDPDLRSAWSGNPVSQRTVALGWSIFQSRWLPIAAVLCVRTTVDGRFSSTLGLYQGFLQQPPCARATQTVSRLSVRPAGGTLGLMRNSDRDKRIIH